MNQNSGLLGLLVKAEAFTVAKQCCFGGLAKLVVSARGVDYALESALDGLLARHVELR